MKILSVSSLFPVPDLLHHGVFVRNRLSAMAQELSTTITVVSPIISSLAHLPFERYKAQLCAPLRREDVGLDIHHPRYFGLPGIFKFIESPSAVFSVLRYVDKHVDMSGVDVIDVHWGHPDLAIGVALSKRYNKPLCFTLRGIETFYQGDSRGESIKSLLSGVSAVISLSEELALHVASLGYEGPVTVVRNGVDVQSFRYQPLSSARGELGIPEDRKMILAVGSLIKRKGYHFLIQALAALPSSTHLYLIGKSGLEGDFESQLRAMCAKLGVAERVHFVGVVPNNKLSTWYNAADVFCLSSYGEGSPNVLSEAATTGCPIIAHNVGEVVPVILDAENGRMLPNPNNYSEAVMVSHWIDALTGFTASRCDQSRELQASRFSTMDWSWCAKITLSAMKKALVL